MNKLQNKKKHIVIVTTWFPPKIGVAVNRMLSFAKYLSKDKYYISVITTSNKSNITPSIDNVSIYQLPNKQLLKPPSFNNDNFMIHKLKVLWKVFVHKLEPNDYKGWTKGSVFKLKEIHSKNPIDIIISSFSPVASHLIALEFIKQHPSTKWVADMRDEMSITPLIDEKTKTYYQSIEKEINKYATALTSVSEPILTDFKKSLPDIPYYEEVRNGYDHELSFSNYNFNDVFTITYCGIFYGNIKPHTFFKALLNYKNLKKEEFNFKIKFIGTPKNFTIPNELKKHIHFYPKIKSDEAIQEMRNSDVNLLINPSSGRKGVYTGKLFDYLSVGKPILGVVDVSDVAAEMIKEYNAGEIASFDNILEIEKTIEKLHLKWLRKEKLTTDIEKIESLHRKHQVKKLEQLIDKL